MSDKVRVWIGPFNQHVDDPFKTDAEVLRVILTRPCSYCDGQGEGDVGPCDFCAGRGWHLVEGVGHEHASRYSDHPGRLIALIVPLSMLEVTDE
jgi:hypothetical protein